MLKVNNYNIRLGIRKKSGTWGNVDNNTPVTLYLIMSGIAS